MYLEICDGIIYVNWIFKKIFYKFVCYIYKFYIVLKLVNVIELKLVNVKVKVFIVIVINLYCM